MPQPSPRGSLFRELTCACVVILPLVLHGQVQPSQAQNGQYTQQTDRMQPQRGDDSQAEQAGSIVSLPSGTKVLMVLKNSISSRNAKPGNGVYLETTFPVVAGGHVVIPAGTFVQGVVDKVRRSGRVKGRAEVLLHFTSLIYPNGYMVTLPGSLESTDSSDRQKVADDEGTVQAPGTKGKDAATVGQTTAAGTAIGAGAGGWKGAGIGGLAGAAVGLGAILLSRGEEVRIESGTSVEMVLQRPVKIDLARVQAADGGLGPSTDQDRKLPRPRRPNDN